MNVTARIVQMPDLRAIAKQIDFGTAKGLTDTAKAAQKASIAAIKSTFTTRGNWMEPSNRFGVRVTPARRDKLTAEVHTAADWLKPHETGEDKRARTGNVAVPTDQVRRNKRMIIPRGQRPKGLAAKAFKLQTKHGVVLAQRLKRGKRKGLIVLYGLEPSVKIKRQSTFYEPIEKAVKDNLRQNIAAGIRFALATRR